MNHFMLHTLFVVQTSFCLVGDNLHVDETWYWPNAAQQLETEIVQDKICRIPWLHTTLKTAE